MKIHIIGGPASGKTWLAQFISNQFDIPTFDLDEIFWDRNADRYGIRTLPKKRDDELTNIISCDSWIIEGVYYSWLTNSFKAADLIIVLKTPTILRDIRILRRFMKRKLGILKTKKESIADFWRLLKWNHGYNENNLSPAMDFISEYNEKIIFPNTKDQAIQEIKKRNL